MTHNFKDPYQYLYDSVVKRGKTGQHGVYLCNVTVVTKADEVFDYRVNEPSISVKQVPDYLDSSVWFETLVRVKTSWDECMYSLNSLQRDTCYAILCEGMQISLSVFIPEVHVELFPYEVIRAQNLLSCLSQFAGKTPSNIRFNIGMASISWVDLVDKGEVEEIEIPM